MAKINIKDIVKILKKEKTNNLDYIVTNGCPKVNIEDKELAVTLGQWMGYLPDSIKTGGSNFSVITSMTAQELLKRKKVTEDDFIYINSKFANILKMAGFGEGNACTLRNFNEEDLAFICSFDGSGDEALMKIRFGSWLDDGPQLTIDFDEIKTVYNYWDFNDHRKPRLEKNYFEKKLDDQGRKFYHYVSPYTYYGDVYDDNNRLYVQIEYPDKTDESNPQSFIDEETMETLLSQITFPADLEDICRKVSSSLKVDSKNFPTISIKVEKNNDKDKKVVTDEALYQNGMLIKLVITKNNKTITLSNFEEWSYRTNEFAVSQTNDKSVSYGFSSMPIDKLETMPSPKEIVEIASKEVEDTRVLAKRLFK